MALNMFGRLKKIASKVIDPKGTIEFIWSGDVSGYSRCKFSPITLLELFEKCINENTLKEFPLKLSTLAMKEYHGNEFVFWPLTPEQIDMFSGKPTLVPNMKIVDVSEFRIFMVCQTEITGILWVPQTEDATHKGVPGLFINKGWKGYLLGGFDAEHIKFQSGSSVVKK